MVLFQVREITIADEGCFISNSIDVHTMAWGTLSFSESNVANAIIIFTWSLWNYVHVSCHITKWEIRNCKSWVLTQNYIILHMIINKRINQFLVFQIVQTIVMFSFYHKTVLFQYHFQKSQEKQLWYFKNAIIWTLKHEIHKSDKTKRILNVNYLITKAEEEIWSKL